MRTRKGFTVIELLIVVVAVIILGLAFAFPVYARYQTKNNEITCRSYIHEIVTAQLQYATDHDERLPVLQREDDDLSKPAMFSVFYQLIPYGFDVSHSRCPSAFLPTRKALRSLNISPTYGFRHETTGLSLDNISNRTTCPITMDLGGPNELFAFGPVERFDGIEVTAVFSKGDQKGLGFDYTHPNGVNIGFADGHVKAIRPYKIPGLLLPNGEMGSRIKSRIKIKRGSINIWTDDRVEPGARLRVLDDKNRVVGTATVDGI